MPTYAAILVAAGQSARFGDPFYKKPFAMLNNRAVWLHSADRFLNHPGVEQVIVVIAEEDDEEFDRRFGANLAILGITSCHGGATRAQSVDAGLRHVRDDVDFVAIHDAARPCLTDRMLTEVFEAAQAHGAAILAHRVTSTLKRERVEGETVFVKETAPRDGLWEAQTPQVFARELITAAHAQPDAPDATDDAQLVERLGKPVALVEGSPLNIKITTKADLKLAEQVLRALPKPKPEGGRNPFADDDLFR
ncbi:2-C-methyl-D-erythritol 4-phosphate cytidylyltransferase [Pirellulimonas nuda]|uniref:2-C-methyl-D-erythritol 4-phosphate cytidylyltransferase n=1 Tax=Pirellulimonas nuda TaxID=2528009 RepID=A0A518DEG8_9BACT|nr:2-C-methyl-D-erythritol 4-phosphate cytidylyltransferase [Pirellulimonas nuda]QDU89875.1 2-C-methyl-D-erythritol 4-phosphate cytidylyltransferase [Pirellulimonas nuda]